MIVIYVARKDCISYCLSCCSTVRERKITVRTCWKFPHEKFSNTSRTLLGTFRAMFPKVFPMQLANDANVYRRAGACCTRFTKTGSRLFSRQILATPLKAKAAKCAFQFWFNDSKKTTVVDELSRDSIADVYLERVYKKKG